MATQTTDPTSPRWPNGARAAIAFTLDNMGEAADLDRNLWPSPSPIGSHYSVTKVLSQFIAILAKYSVPATYFIESWNLNVYPEAIREIAAAGLEVSWHAWRHEAWGKLNDEEAERANFDRSFGEEGLKGFIERSKGDGDVIQPYRGFRPPGGIIHGERTLGLCREHGLEYISPAGREAAIVPLQGRQDSIVVLPFKWETVDAYYYMESFSGLRKIKGDPEEPQSEEVLGQRLISQIEGAIATGGYLSTLFHPFLNESVERLRVFEMVVSYLAKKRDKGVIWLARCQDVQEWLRERPDTVGSDPLWDETSWR